MKVQVIYRFTGEDVEKLESMLKKINEILKDKNFETYIQRLDFDNEGKTPKEIYFNGINQVKNHDCVLAIVKSENKSEGMLMEIGAVLSNNKKFILAINKNVVETNLRNFADIVIEFDDLNDLYKSLGETKLEI